MPAAIVFPDAAEIVATYLREALAAAGFPVRVGTRVPNPRPDEFVRLKRIGGARLDVVTDRPRLDVHCWGADDERAHDLTQITRALLLAIPGWHGAAAYDVAEVGGPNELPDPETSSPRLAFAVEVSLRGKRLAPVP
ncbi:hypothetical protein [Streptomyces swartbergensis]|uniref:DUF3168 domain-containing protein n=1 Tax=Streptomyces swartbergensis TaxID=487165 RepID=A0A243S4W4_9ACTN|nr:hypothetical protein [Streptomyces swartbergensis]OUD02569.1 hypothetical protein CA983_14180 [Streptomyces swartbergensis]